jgi:hypothetical protein
MLIAVMIPFYLIWIYIQNRKGWPAKAGQQRLASKGWPRARVVQGSRYHRYDIDYDIIGYDIYYDIMTMISPNSKYHSL